MEKITPSWKSDTMNGELDLLTQIIWNGKDRQTCIEEGTCITCDEARGLIATSFRDDVSRKEYAISAMCQSCQDDVFGVSDDEPYEDEMWADDDALGSAGMGTDEYYF